MSKKLSRKRDIYVFIYVFAPVHQLQNQTLFWQDMVCELYYNIRLLKKARREENFNSSLDPKIFSFFLYLHVPAFAWQQWYGI
jgi:hypothetical protein